MQESAFIPIMVVLATAITAPIFVLMLVANKGFRTWVVAVVVNIASGAVANFILMFPGDVGAYYEPVDPLPYILLGFVIGFVCSLVIFMAMKMGRGGSGGS